MRTILPLRGFIFVSFALFIHTTMLGGSSFQDNSDSLQTSHNDQANDRIAIQSLFAERTALAPEMAYESDFYKYLVDKEKANKRKLIYQNDIENLKAKHVKIESDIAKQKSPKNIAKLETQQKEVKNEIAYCEIQDAPTISHYAQEEYDKMIVIVSCAYAANKSKAESRQVVFEKIQKLMQESEMNFQLGSTTMASGYSLSNQLERAKNCRKVFAIEALSIDQLDQAVDIINNLELLTKYSNEELIAMLDERNDNMKVIDETPQVVSEKIPDVVITDSALSVDTSAGLTATTSMPEQVESVQPIEKESEKVDENEVMTLTEMTKHAIPENASSNKSGDCRINESDEEAFFTVQVGAFIKKADHKTLQNCGEVCTDQSNKNITKYTSGKFTSLQEAMSHLANMKAAGISDAFITAYKDGKRVTVREVNELLSAKTR